MPGRSATAARRRPAVRTLATRPPLRRLMWALSRLRTGTAIQATDLAQEFEVSLRTAYRDFDFLRDEWRVPIEYDHGQGTYRLTDAMGALPLVSVSAGELLALYFADKVVRQYRGTPFEADLASAFAKMQELMPEQVRVSPASLDDYLSLDLGPVHTPDARVFRDLLTALRQRRVALIRYKSLSSNRTADRRVDPLHVFNLGGNWYVAAWDRARQQVRDFALHRVRRLTLTTETYEVPKGFDFRRYMADAFAIEKGGRAVEVAIRFAPRQSRWIRERKWHRSARIQEAIDGSVTLRLKVPASGELQRWVLQFGSEAEVLRPPALRRAVAAELRRASARYRARS